MYIVKQLVHSYVHNYYVLQNKISYLKYLWYLLGTVDTVQMKQKKHQIFHHSTGEKTTNHH